MKLFLFVFYLLCPSILGTWTHLSGQQTINTNADTSTLPSYPGGLKEHAVSMLNDYIFIFGGQGYDETGFGLECVSDNSFTWMYGTASKTANFVSPAPGGLSKHSMVLANDNLYVFGGSGYDDAGTLGCFNIMWQYSLNTMTWQILYGDTALDVSADYVASRPGSMDSQAMTTDGEYIYIYGGNGYDNSVNRGHLNDLWRFKIVTQVWDYLSGSKTINTPSEYTLPLPGGLYDHSMVINGTKTLVVFGGHGYTADPFAWDLWMYDLATDVWSHVYGSKTLNAFSDFDYPYPGGLSANRMVMKDSKDLYILGGFGYDNHTTFNSGSFNSLWKYDISTGIWAYLDGTKAVFVQSDYSDLYPSALNFPNIALEKDRIYVFGGEGYDASGSSGELNDLWMYTIQTTPVSSMVETTSYMETTTISSAENIPVSSIAPETTTISSAVNTPLSSMESITMEGTSDVVSIQKSSQLSSSDIVSSEAEVVVIDNNNISNTTIVDGDIIFVDNTNNNESNVIVIDNVEISSTGTISIYTDIKLEGNSKIRTSKCISAYNNSQIIVDLTSRSKQESEVVSYNCATKPDLNIDLIGSYEDGCVPRYDVQQSSIILLLDTQSCTSPSTDDNMTMIIAVIVSVAALCIIIGVILVIVFVNKK